MRNNVATGAIYLIGALWEIEVEYSTGDSQFEIESAKLIGAYQPGDNVARRDYTSLATDVEIDISELSERSLEILDWIVTQDIARGE